MARFRVLGWLLCLTALAVGTRNFEQGGLSVDGPLYALMARTVARTGDWFYLQGTVPHFIPYSDHPHLGIWLLALTFKILPAADWSARIPGMLFYLGFMGLLYRFVKNISGEQTAFGTVVLLWTLDRFSSYCSNAYLDPGALFFGSSAVFLLYESFLKRKPFLSFLAGVSIAACTMTKGLTVLGFGPALLWVLWHAGKASKTEFRKYWTLVGWFLVGVISLLGAYLVVVLWHVPVMLERYWFNQWTNRFSRQWDWSALWKSRFWFSLNRDSHYFLVPAVLLALWRRPRTIEWLPWILLGSFALLYAPADRVGVQYWVMLLPWVAWGLATSLFRNSQWSTRLPMSVTAGVSVTLVFLIQFFPLRVHGAEDLSLTHLQRRIREGRVEQAILDLRPSSSDFTIKDKYFWYLDVPLEMIYQGTAAPAVRPKTAYIIYEPSQAVHKEVAAKGWCWDDTVSGRAVYLDCPRELDSLPIDQKR